MSVIFLSQSERPPPRGGVIIGLCDLRPSPRRRVNRDLIGATDPRARWREGTRERGRKKISPPDQLHARGAGNVFSPGPPRRINCTQNDMRLVRAENRIPGRSMVSPERRRRPVLPPNNPPGALGCYMLSPSRDSPPSHV